MTTSPFKLELGKNVVYEYSGLEDALSVKPSKFFYDYYILYVSHGATLTSSNVSMNISLFDKDFSDMNFFSLNEKVTFLNMEGSNITPNLISHIINIPTYIINKGTRSTGWNVPPMMFGVFDEDAKSQVFQNLMGLWFIDYKKSQIERIVNFDEILNISKMYNYKITYSVIDKLVREKVALLKSEGRITPGPHKMGMGFFSCRSAYPDVQYLSEEIREVIPAKLGRTNYFSFADIYYATTETYFRPFFFNAQCKYNADVMEVRGQDPSRFKPLATGVRHQGCALNVLSFYKILDAAYARNAVLCLTLRGTSIFKILEFINQAIYENNSEPVNYYAPRPTSSKKYLIIRYRMDGFRSFIGSITDLIRYYAIVVKFYKDLLNPKSNITNTRYSHVGHTVSFYVSYYEGYGNIVYMIDPQNDSYMRVGTPEFDQFLSNFRYYDIIYEVTTKEEAIAYRAQGRIENTPSPYIISSSDIKFLLDSEPGIDFVNKGVFIMDYEELNFGGGKKKGTASSQSQRGSPTGVWELEEEEVAPDAVVQTPQRPREVYKFDGLPYSTPVLAPETSKRAYKYFMDSVRKNEVKIPGSRRRKTVSKMKSRKTKNTGRSSTRRRKTI